MTDETTIQPVRDAERSGAGPTDRDAQRSGAGPTDRDAQRSGEHAVRRAATVPARPHVGLVVPGSRGLGTADGLASWLLASAARSDVVMDVVDLDGDPADRDRDGYVLLVGQYGPEPAPAVGEVVSRLAARWSGRPIGLVTYGGVSRGRDAAARVRGTLCALDAVVVDACLGVNVAALRGEGPSAFERLGWEMVLDDVARACVRPATAP